jgi:polyhydroxybutyrate depolymerase
MAIRLRSSRGSRCRSKPTGCDSRFGSRRPNLRCCFLGICLVLSTTLAKPALAETFHVGYRVLDLPFKWAERDVTLTTNIWYPTDAVAATHTYAAGRGERDTLLAVGAPASRRRRPYPVVFFAHGGFGCGVNSAFLMEHLAAHGYVGVSIDYVDFQPPDYTRQVYSCRTRGHQALERHRNREIKLSTGLPDLAEDLLQYIRIFTHEPQVALPWITEGRAKPTSHVLDRVLEMNADPDSFLFEAIDEGRIAISGHSAGGITLESLIGGLPEFTDERFKAAVIFSAPLFPLYEENIPSVKIPIMVWAGDNDPAAINPRQSQTARRDVYDLVTTPKYFLIVKDSDHFTFGNPRPAGGSRSLQEAVESSPQSQLIRDYSMAFLDKYLLDDPSAGEVLVRNDPRLQYYVREETPSRPVAFGTEVFTEVATAPAQDQTNYLEFDGVNRSYYVHTPDSYDGETPLPVVLILHGGGGDGASTARTTGMNDTSDEAGFIAVYPNGYPVGGGRHSWNAGTCCEPAVSRDADDVGFISAVLDDLDRLYSVDLARVYSTGVSNGAMMSYTLASELSERIAAISPVAAAMGFDTIESRRPVPVLHIHGSEDHNAPPEGGVGSNSRAGIVHIPLQECIQRWVTFNGCSPTPVVTDLPDLVEDGTTIRREEYGTCRGGAEVTLYLVDGGGHTWPGMPYEDFAEYYLERCRLRNIEPNPTALEYYRQAGRASRDISANDVIWEFFSRHSLEEQGG